MTDEAVLARMFAGRMRIRDADIEILRAVPMRAVLPAATIEQLRAGLDHAEFAPGQMVFAQGDAGNRFSVVESGRADVVRDGRVVNTLARGAGFGFDEIALLDDRPRTATILASRDEPLCGSVLLSGAGGLAGLAQVKWQSEAARRRHEAVA